MIELDLSIEFSHYGGSVSNGHSECVSPSTCCEGK